MNTKRKSFGAFSLVELMMVIAIIAILSTIIVPKAAAQIINGNVTNMPPINYQDFITTAKLWVTAGNTDLTNTFAPFKKLTLHTPMEYVSGVNVSANLGISYDVCRASSNSTIAAELTIKNAGVAGTILAVEAGASYNFVPSTLPNLKATLICQAGYDRLNKSALVEPGILRANALTDNTALEIGLKLPIHRHCNWLPSVTVGPIINF